MHLGATLTVALFLICAPSESHSALIPPNSQHIYELVNEVSIRELTKSTAPDTQKLSYRFSSQLHFSSVWNKGNAQLLEVHFEHNVISAGPGTGKQKADTLHQLVELPDRPFYISLVDDKPQNVIAHSSRDQSILNLKRGIASLLLLQFEDGPVSELDVSGRCTALYTAKSSTRVEKTKTDCSLWDLRVHERAEQPLGVSRHSLQHIVFELSTAGELLRAKSMEKHRMALTAKPDAGSEVHSLFTLKHMSVVQEGEEITQLPYETLDEAVQSLLEWNRVFDIAADVDGSLSEIKDVTLKTQVKKFAKILGNDYIGKAKLAMRFTQLIPLARITSQAELVEILREHESLQPQLVDLLGAVQTAAAHGAIMEVFSYERLSDRVLIEKYLQALAIGAHPERKIIEDLIDVLESANSPIKDDEKLLDTMTQTLAALTRQFGFERKNHLYQRVLNHFFTQLSEKCANEVKCKARYIRALQNLRDPTTIGKLFEFAYDASKVVSVSALQALKAFPLGSFNDTNRKEFAAIFYQQQRKFDSSARALALEILLALKPSHAQLGELVDYLRSSDRTFEMKTYVLQKLRTLAERCPRFRALLSASLAARPEINNYHILAQKGLTTVLARQLTQDPAFNETLVSIQEVSRGLLKRGSVELILNAGREELSVFKLGIFASGMNNFAPEAEPAPAEDLPEDDDDSSGDEEAATAGMEISVQGVQLRPLVFFDGNAELMGHVFAGTASERTPAYQATTLVHDHENYIILASGLTLYMRLLSTRSVDLGGKVTMSLWYKNSQSEIEQSAATAIAGQVVVGFTHARLTNEFKVWYEPKLSLKADLEFYDKVKLCIQLQRPEMQITHTNNKMLVLKNVKKPYKKYITKVTKHKSNGNTFVLNQKNNEMCNMILN